MNTAARANRGRVVDCTRLHVGSRWVVSGAMALWVAVPTGCTNWPPLARTPDAGPAASSSGATSASSASASSSGGAGTDGGLRDEVRFLDACGAFAHDCASRDAGALCGQCQYRFVFSPSRCSAAQPCDRLFLMWAAMDCAAPQPGAVLAEIADRPGWLAACVQPLFPGEMLPTTLGAPMREQAALTALYDTLKTETGVWTGRDLLMTGCSAGATRYPVVAARTAGDTQWLASGVNGACFSDGVFSIPFQDAFTGEGAQAGWPTCAPRHQRMVEAFTTSTPTAGHACTASPQGQCACDPAHATRAWPGACDDGNCLDYESIITGAPGTFALASGLTTAAFAVPHWKLVTEGSAFAAMQSRCTSDVVPEEPLAALCASLDADPEKSCTLVRYPDAPHCSAYWRNISTDCVHWFEQLPPPPADPVASLVHSIMQPAVDPLVPPNEDSCVGAVVALVTPDGARVLGYGATHAAGSMVPDGETLFQVGSVTKVFTGLALARLVASGDINVENPANMDLAADLAPALVGSGITMAHLVTHRAGLPNMPGNLVDRDRDGVPDPGHDPLSPAAGYARADLVVFLDQFTPLHAPGAAYAYSNAGVGLLAVALQDHLGMDNFHAVLSAQVTSTLGMDETWGEIDVIAAPALARLAQGYASVNGTIIPGHLAQMGVLAGSGEITTTGNNMLLFLSAVTGNTSTPLDAAVDLALAPLAGGPPGQDMGYAFEIEPRVDGDVFTKGGVTSSYSAFLAFRREPRVGVLVMSNCGGFFAPKAKDLALAINQGLSDLSR